MRFDIPFKLNVLIICLIFGCGVDIICIDTAYAQPPVFEGTSIRNRSKKSLSSLFGLVAPAAQMVMAAQAPERHQSTLTSKIKQTCGRLPQIPSRIAGKNDGLTALKHEWQRVCGDYRHFYSREPLLNLGVAVGLHAVISNTAMDQNFRNWYQEDVRSEGMNNFSTFFKVFGEGKYFIPTMVVGDLVYRYCQEKGAFKRATHPLGEFASRTTRSYLVGGPVVLVGQYLLGSSRPDDHRSYHSQWNPFEDNNAISGHAFIGAAPFIVAAQMSDRFWIKASFYTLSAMPGLSRVNDDAHYLSQVLLGWYVAYLAARSVAHNEGVKLPKGLTIFPVTESNAVGLGFLYRR